MRNVFLRRATEQDTHMADSPNSTRRTHVRPTNSLAPSTPRWVKVLGIIIIVLVVLFVLMHLTGHGFGDHMHLSTIE